MAGKTTKSETGKKVEKKKAPSKLKDEQLSKVQGGLYTRPSKLGPYDK